jgi:selenide,water dikinase
MLLSNKAAADCFKQYQAKACTDITGFGLLGHLMEMMKGSEIAVELVLEKIPLLSGATETIKQGFLSSIHSENIQVSQCIQNLDQVLLHPLYPILFDPQTAGGLLAGIPAELAENCLQELRNLGYDRSCKIGQVTASNQESFPIKIKI